MNRLNLRRVAAALAVLGLAAAVYAVGIPNPFVNEAGLSYSKRYTIDLNAAAVNTVSATAVYSSGTFANSSFTTGQVSTGSFLVADNTKLAAAAATNSLTVLSTSGVIGDSIVVTKLNKPGAYVFLAGRDWRYKSTTALTAASIKAALDTVPYFATSRSGAILYSTATASGADANGIYVQTNSPSTLSVSSPTFLGGRNATVVTVNGTPFKAGVQFAIGAAASNTATNLANAIAANTRLAAIVTAGTATSSVTLQSVHPGAVYNFSLASSNSAAVAPLNPTMVGGATPSWVLNGKNITVSSHGYPLALPLLYRPGAGAAAISGLTAETTYFAIPVDANTLKLASSSGNAQAGTAITLASTSTLTAAKSYSLLPLTFSAAATTGGKWQVSNDNATWSDVSASSFSWIGGGSVAGSANWDLGKIDYRYLSLNVVGPNAGGLVLRVTATGSYTP